MMFRVTAVCDGCGPDWWKGSADSLPTFPSRTDALDQLTADYLWRTTKRADGTTGLLCPACANLEDCARHGHTWVPLAYEFDGEMRQYGEVCSHCSVVRGGDGPTGTHPESLTVELSDADEEWLAFLDAELDPDRANEAA